MDQAAELRVEILEFRVVRDGVSRLVVTLVSLVLPNMDYE